MVTDELRYSWGPWPTPVPTAAASDSALSSPPAAAAAPTWEGVSLLDDPHAPATLIIAATAYHGRARLYREFGVPAELALDEFLTALITSFDLPLTAELTLPAGLQPQTSMLDCLGACGSALSGDRDATALPLRLSATLPDTDRHVDLEVLLTLVFSLPRETIDSPEGAIDSAEVVCLSGSGTITGRAFDLDGINTILDAHHSQALVPQGFDYAHPGLLSALTRAEGVDFYTVLSALDLSDPQPLDPAAAAAMTGRLLCCLDDLSRGALTGDIEAALTAMRLLLVHDDDSGVAKLTPLGRKLRRDPVALATHALSCLPLEEHGTARDAGWLTLVCAAALISARDSDKVVAHALGLAPLALGGAKAALSRPAFATGVALDVLRLRGKDAVAPVVRLSALRHCLSL